MCTGSDSNCDYLKIFLSALDMQLAFHPSSLEVTLLIISWNVVFDGFPWNMGHLDIFLGSLYAEY